MNAMNVLVVEDDPAIAKYLSDGLRSFGHETLSVISGEAGLQHLAHNQADVIVLDRMLPSICGLSMLKTLRSRGDATPVLMLSALGTLDQRIEGLDAGADDYLVKPFEIGEVAARLNAIVRRASAAVNSGAAFETLRVGSVTIDPAQRRATRAGRMLHLNNKEFGLLVALVRNADKLVTRKMLIEIVWGYSFDPNTNIVESNLSRLRAKLLRDGADTDPVETVRGAGYILRTGLA